MTPIQAQISHTTKLPRPLHTDFFSTSCLLSVAWLTSFCSNKIFNFAICCILRASVWAALASVLAAGLPVVGEAALPWLAFVAASLVAGAGGGAAAAALAALAALGSDFFDSTPISEDSSQYLRGLEG